ncbi:MULTISPECIES: hypothetical protein [unclassified Mesorhizobium]|uniref:hypothetical protein n=1 Tax=unclassified Mesorhizobium TaxID=325217 RepID=UPI000F753F65|nr:MULTISPECIES: hypothetical protein [unclassified Mesorhizobium]AZO51271.1 hypothetical protein EJ073_28765 [Mesorhizobium sp. M4B.F.Ca.ET.058.02.1.1]RVC43685.1 hypothetical protein EN781_17195 [Mesorhizobium sp. M4A.F.Ca.ET.090.04.2.1]
MECFVIVDGKTQNKVPIGNIESAKKLALEHARGVDDTRNIHVLVRWPGLTPPKADVVIPYDAQKSAWGDPRDWP